MAEAPPIEMIARIELDAEKLMARHPPLFKNDRKRMLFETIKVPITGMMTVSRWRGALPTRAASSTRPELEMREAIFSYPAEEPGTTIWHVNFADAELFGYYGGPLLAQDEHQVLEHPVLGSLREALIESRRSNAKLAPRTREGEPTPYLIRGAQRSLSFDTVAGPYGNAFAAASTERISASTTLLEVPTYSNILAMVAPPGGYGRYSHVEIGDVLATAFVGFGACRLESGDSKCVVYTGNWGCGAFGGNPVLMTLLQLCAVQLAGVDGVVFHTVAPRFSRRYAQAVALLDDLAPGADIDTQEFIEKVHALGFEWGESDGN